MKKLAIFDLDNTLIGADSDYLWGEYLCEQGIVDADSYRQQNQRFYDEYIAGTLDIDAFLAFQLAPLAAHGLTQLKQWREQFLTQKIMPVMLPKANTLIEGHRKQGHELLIITATNRFITEPIAKLLGIADLIATDAEMRDGVYTGRPFGTPSFASGKVERFAAWVEKTGQTFTETWFYSDSHNDIPLLEQVDHPVAVDADERLRKLAHQRGWECISLRD